jgi:hypothetical protein
MQAKQIYLFKTMKTHIDTSGKVFVNGYRRCGGTYVKPYWRKHPSRQIGAGRHVPVRKEQLPLFKSD